MIVWMKERKKEKRFSYLCKNIKFFQKWWINFSPAMNLSWRFNIIYLTFSLSIIQLKGTTYTCFIKKSLYLLPQKPSIKSSLLGSPHVKSSGQAFVVWPMIRTKRKKILDKGIETEKKKNKSDRKSLSFEDKLFWERDQKGI